jgi:hypothetical protein
MQERKGEFELNLIRIGQVRLHNLIKLKRFSLICTTKKLFNWPLFINLKYLEEKKALQIPMAQKI